VNVEYLAIEYLIANFKARLAVLERGRIRHPEHRLRFGFRDCRRLVGRGVCAQVQP
jgi:hypothetical protein